MGLSETRKIISVVISAITAIASAILIVSLLINSTLTSEPYLEKVIVTDELVSECDAQLTAKYEVLSAETGMPARVFEQVKSEYKLEDSIVRAFQNVFSDEDATLYTPKLLEYFETLCTEFLQDSSMTFDESDIKRTAKKAALIFCDTVGFHDSDPSSKRMKSLKDGCSKAGLAALLVILIGLLLLAVIYTDKQKGFLYSILGFSAGALGTTIGSLMLMIFRVWNRVSLLPVAMDNAENKAIQSFLLILIIASFGLAAVSYIVYFVLQKKLDKKEERAIVV